jgi:hypothetical protein
MPARMLPEQFVTKSRPVTLSEQATAQEYIIDLCALIQHPTPAEYDPHGYSFCFQKRFSRSDGKWCYIDFWKRGFFAWECKRPGKHKTHDTLIAS